MRTSTRPTTTKKRPRGRLQYTPRPCAICSAEAAYAFNVLTRTVGKGQGQRTRKIKVGMTVLLCERCSRLGGLSRPSLQSSQRIVCACAATSPGIKLQPFRPGGGLTRWCLSTN